MTLSIIIVNYNVKHFLHQCLKSIERSKKNIDVEIFVVDNNSVDGSINMIQNEFPDVKLIANEKNTGFATANNQAIKKAQGEYILLLNPDTLIEENTLHETIIFFKKHKEAGALGVKMIDGNGDFLPESKRSLPSPSIAFYKIFGLSFLFPKSKKFGKYHLNYLDKEKTHEIDVISGAFFMTRKKILDEIGLLDEKFFMYGEDIDLSYRIQKKGYKNFYLPTTSIIHYKGESTKKTSINYILTFYQAMIIFVKKHYDTKKANPLIFMINTAILIRASISIVKRILSKLIYPILDILIMLFSMYILKNIWATNYFSDKNYYNDTFFEFVIPFYILFWLSGIWLKNGYNQPVKTSNITKGVLVGTIGLLIAYGLLPENLRFSRALIILGALAIILNLLCLRHLLNLLPIDFLKTQSNKMKRIGIIANDNEFKRISRIINTTNQNTNIIGQINIDKNKKSSLGKLQQLKEIITIYKLNEIIFSAKDITAKEMMTYMSKMHKRIDIKIAPTESTFIIGSNSIHSQGTLYSLENTQKQKSSIKTFFKKYIDFFN
ncbi:MAG: glycosyl transferase family 2 [Flavobacteriales bacterium]|nr:glycosyl transferase family 2 [Flavobacteriales bacterium]